MTRFSFLVTLPLFHPSSAWASGIEVHVTIEDAAPTARGHSCSVWHSEVGFASDASVAVATTRSTKTRSGWVCVLNLPKAGRYAIALMDDANGNGQVDTNWLGRPVEGWGTSNNMTSTFRGPTFDESAIELSEGSSLSIVVHR